MKDERKTKRQLIAELEQLRSQCAEANRRVAELVKAEAERKRVEEALRRHEQEILLIAEGVPALFSYVGTDGRYRFVNRRYEEWFDMPRTEIIGRHYREILGEATYETIRERVETVLSGQRVRYEEALPYARGGSRWVIAEYVPDVDDQGHVNGFFALVTDITERKQAEEALRESEERYRSLFEGAEDHIFVLDQDFRYVMVNPSALKACEFTLQDVVGRGPREVFPQDAEFYLSQYRRAFETGEPVWFERELRLLDGAHWFSVKLSPIKDAQGRVIALTGISRDVTKRVRAEKALRRRNEELAALNAITAAVSRSLDLQEILNRALDKVLEITGMEAGSMYLMDPQAEELVLVTYRGTSEEFADTVRTFRMGESLAGQAGQSGEPIVADDLVGDPRVTTTLVSGEGIRAFASIPMKAKEKVQGVMNIASHQTHSFSPEEMRLYTAIANQIGVSIENARLFEQVQAWRDRLALLTQHIVSAQEEERQRIAQELHDELGQALTAIAFDLAAIEGELEPEVAPAIKKRLAEARSLADRVDERVSEIALDLRPSMLDDLGLLSALRWYVNRYTQRLDIEVEVEGVGLDERLLPEVETALYRMVQEALTNVAKHAQASKVGVRLERTESAVVAIVEDDGQGFAVEAVAGLTPPQRGAGLLGIRERANLLGGNLSIESTPGQGTRLVIEVPIYDFRAAIANRQSEIARRA